jgi:hypothetical protein
VLLVARSLWSLSDRQRIPATPREDTPSANAKPGHQKWRGEWFVGIAHKGLARLFWGEHFPSGNDPGGERHGGTTCNGMMGQWTSFDFLKPLSASNNPHSGRWRRL